MKVALVYDRVNKFGGAERVLLALHEIWPEAPLYTSVYDKKAAPWANVFEVRTSFLQKLPLPKNEHELYPFLMGIAFESFNFDEFDLVISVTAEFAKAIITKPKTVHICYCLTPTSYLWSGYKNYFHQKPRWFKFLSKPLINYLRWYDKIIAHRPDKYVAISKTVQERIKKIYNQESKIVYPSIASQGVVLRTQDHPFKNDFYLIVSRLAPQKRIDLAVKAFNELGLPLKIIGTGREFKSLKSLSKSNIEFLGYLTDEEVAGYYKSCRAVVICGEEDFNLVAVEAQSFGKPVIAFGRGGVTETVIEGKTGWFFSHQKKISLIRLIRQIRLEKINPEDCIENAKRFSKERFQEEFKKYVRQIKTDN